MTTQKFGGEWTEKKIEILVEYAKAYLSIMNLYADKFKWHLLYFDGFAGSGEIAIGNKEDHEIILGASTRILEIDQPRPFDEYYFVEKDPRNHKRLMANTKEKFPQKRIHVKADDCNVKLQAMAEFLASPKGRKVKVLAYIDPYGMQLNWASLQCLHTLSVDIWVLVPTGMGINRLLKSDAAIPEKWLSRMEVFLGMERTDIMNFFYTKQKRATLFGDEEKTIKVATTEHAAELYKSKLRELFNFVSEPYIIKNSSNSVMYHFMMASNNETAIKKANKIVKNYNKN